MISRITNLALQFLYQANIKKIIIKKKKEKGKRKTKLNTEIEY